MPMLCAWLDLHRNAAGHDFGDEAELEGPLGPDGRQLELAQDVGRDGLDLDVGKVDADAEARAAAEGDERVRRLAVLLAGRLEADGVEFVRVGEVLRHAMTAREGET